MSVHVGEVHVDIGPGLPAQPEVERTHPGEAADRQAEADRRTRWLARRVAAEGFDD